MRVPLSWLREYVALPADVPATDVAERLVRAGLAVEALSSLGTDLAGPIVIGRVLAFEEETHKNGKTIRWCQVDVGEAEPRGIVCGARNFAVDDLVVVARPGAVLPGGFAITARKTYGHVSDGMICSTRELGIGDDHEGILVLQVAAEPGAEALDLLDVRDDVIELEVTPDRGYCLSMRGVAREVATAYGLDFTDPADSVDLTTPLDAGWPVELADVSGCDRFVAVTITGFDPGAGSPMDVQRRISRAGMRPISLAVDITNYVMLELGHPLHAYDRARLEGPIVVRRARPGEKLTTLDGTRRALDPDDLLITDDSGPIGIAGVMGGASTEISETTRDIVLEAAHFIPAVISRSARRHRLISEASKRFERGVDTGLSLAAAMRAAELLTRLGGGRVAGVTITGTPPAPSAIRMRADLPGRVAGRPISVDAVRSWLVQIGGTLTADPSREGVPTDGMDASATPVLVVDPPTWRPDLVDPADLVEEVLRLEGYESIPSVLPAAPGGRGLTRAQSVRRRVARLLAATGFVETASYPFLGADVWDSLGVRADDRRRSALRLANPLSDAEPFLRTSLLPGLLAVLRRNAGRGASDLALFEIGTVFLPRPGQPDSAPVLGVERRPTDDELAAQNAALPDQPRHLALVLSGHRERTGWWGPGRQASWADAVQACLDVAAEAGLRLQARSGQEAPWHPGRCAQLVLVDPVDPPGGDVDREHGDRPAETRSGERVVGYAGELHPRVVAALDLPARTCAAELDLDILESVRPPLVQAPVVSTFPVAHQDVALVVPGDVPAAGVEAALRIGAGPLLESVRLFDVYTGSTVGAGAKSLAYRLSFRAPDRTLTSDEVSSARDAAVAEASRITGAVLRGPRE